LHRRNGRLPETIDLYQISRDHARWLVDHPRSVTRYRELLIQTLYGLGHVFLELKRVDEAERHFLQVRDLLESLRRQSPHRYYPRRGLANVWEDLGTLLLIVGKVEEAEKAVRRSVDLRRDLENEFPNPHGMATGSALHGNILARLGRFDEAESVFATSVTFQEKLTEQSGNSGRREE